MDKMTLLLKKKMRRLYNHLVVALVELGVIHCKKRKVMHFPGNLAKTRMYSPKTLLTNLHDSKDLSQARVHILATLSRVHIRKRCCLWQVWFPNT